MPLPNEYNLRITMGGLKKVNVVRRNIMRSLTRNIGVTNLEKDFKLKEKPEIKRILIIRPNKRLGNLLLITPLLQEVNEAFPNCKIDIFVRGGLAPILFENYSNVDRIIKLPGKPFKELIKYSLAWLSVKKKRYDMVINVVNSSSSGRLSTKFATAKFKHFGDVSDKIKEMYTDSNHMAKYPVYNFRYFLSKLGYEKNDKPVPPLNLRLSDKELEQGKQIVKDIVKNDKKTIAIFTFATGDKCYKPEWWNPFYERLQAEYANDYNIIEILPVENVSQIDFKAPTYYSKEIREIGGVMAACEVFIGADSGMMHLAASSLVPTIGLFSYTNPATYGPYNKGSESINTNNTTMDSWIESINKALKA